MNMYKTFTNGAVKVDKSQATEEASCGAVLPPLYPRNEKDSDTLYVMDENDFPSLYVVEETDFHPFIAGLVIGLIPFAILIMWMMIFK